MPDGRNSCEKLKRHKTQSVPALYSSYIEAMARVAIHAYTFTSLSYLCVDFLVLECSLEASDLPLAVGGADKHTLAVQVVVRHSNLGVSTCHMQ